MSTGGAVYDRGYRPYDGILGGRRASATALYRTSLRRAIGLRRPWRQKVMPFVLLAIAVVPAVVNVGVGYLTRDTPARDFSFITYREYVGVSSALLLFVALVAPDLMCPDRRQRVLSLIFARPLTGVDYVLAKVGAIFTCVFAFSFLPQVVLYVGQMLVSDGALDYLRHNTAVLWQVPVAVALLALFYAVLGVAVASLSGRRIVAGATLLGITLVSSSVSAIIVESSRGHGPDVPGHPAALLNILALPLYVRDLVFLGHLGDRSPLSGVTGGGALAVACYLAVVGAGIAVLLVRYRSAEL
ncbi:MAG: type transport system permease protein [Actinomycetota bacterium]|nr:type transport system permease protein [Actinomycetota bacterium]